MKPTKHITIGWLYPELMSTYGDRGNIIVFTKRCRWRDIGVTVYPIDFTSRNEDIEKCSIIFGGGAQDRQQAIVIDDLLKNKKHILTSLFRHDIPGLFVCGSPQLLGQYYTTGDGTKLTGLGIFDMVSKHPGDEKPRCIGNLVGIIGEKMRIPGLQFRRTIVGFENHGGRTYLGNGVQPFARVIYGNGNNGEDKTEGAQYRNCIATYSHGPFLTKNPHIADWLIVKALEAQGHKKILLTALDDTVSWRAHDYMLTRLHVR